MALNDIGQDRFQRRLTKELDIQGDKPSGVLAPEIQPVLIIEGERPELLHLQREHRFAATLTLAAVVGEYYYFALWNPANSGMIAVVERFSINSITGVTSWDFGPAIATILPSLAGRAAYCLDTRLPQNPLGRPGVCEPYCGTDAGTGGLAVFGRTRSNANYFQPPIELNYVITPGTGFAIRDIVANQSEIGWMIWRERRAEDGELT